MIHRRQIAYDDRSRCWEIQDYIYGPGRHRLEAFWHFDPQRRVELVGHTVATDIGQVDFLGPAGMLVRVDDTSHSASYGQQCPAKRAVCVFEGALPVTLRTRLQPTVALNA